MITQATAARIWEAYREIDSAEKLLADIAKAKEEDSTGGPDRHAPTLRDAFGRKRHMQLGVPSGENAHQLFRVSHVLAESVIRAHIADKRSELAEAQEQARIELHIKHVASEQ